MFSNNEESEKHISVILRQINKIAWLFIYLRVYYEFHGFDSAYNDDFFKNPLSKNSLLDRLLPGFFNKITVQYCGRF